MSWVLVLILSWVWSALAWGPALPHVGPGTPHSAGGGGGAPTFISENESTWDNSTGQTRDTPSTAVTNGDLLVVVMMSEDVNVTGTLTVSTVSGSTSAWTVQQDNTTLNNCKVVTSTATATATGNVTARMTRGNTNAQSMGINMLVFRNHGGVGASAKTTGSGAPTLNLTTTKASSAIVVANADWAAVATARTWRANAGALTEVSYFNVGGSYTIYAGYHANAGAIATYAVGLSAPTGQTYAIQALEVKGP